MTVDDLLTMRSGLDWQEGDPIYRAMYMSSDWVKFVLDKPMKEQPGANSTIVPAVRTFCQPSSSRKPG